MPALGWGRPVAVLTKSDQNCPEADGSRNVDFLIDLLAVLRAKVVAASLAIGFFVAFIVYQLVADSEPRVIATALAFVVAFAASLVAIQRGQRE